jgi:hypothetical protein
MVEKYGQPNRNTTETYQNKLGAEFKGVVADWDTPWGTLEFDQRSEQLDVSVIQFNLDKLSAETSTKPF